MYVVDVALYIHVYITVHEHNPMMSLLLKLP
jgi:hypothetical protein